MAETFTLDNGVRIVLNKMPYVRSVAVGIYVKNGSKDEDLQTNGISHFIEHMLFKGTENRSAKKIAEEMDEIGGQLNAYTTKEYTCFYTRVLDTHTDLALDVLCDMYFNSKFSEEEICKERGVIIEEINMYEDTPDELVYDALQYEVWRHNSLGLPILGTEESISKFTHDTFKKYMGEHYNAKNTVVAVAGNFDTKHILKKIEAYFEGMDNKNRIEKANSPLIYVPSVIKNTKDIEQMHLCMSFPGVSALSNKTYALSAFNTMFGGGMSSILFQSVRENAGLAYSVYSYNSNYSEGGLFNIYAGLNPNQLDAAISLIYEEIKNLFDGKINQRLLDKTKEQLKSNFILSQESVMNILSGMGRRMILLGDTISIDEQISRIDSISIEDIHQLINEILDLNKCSVSLVGRVADLDCSKYVIW